MYRGAGEGQPGWFYNINVLTKERGEGPESPGQLGFLFVSHVLNVYPMGLSCVDAQRSEIERGPWG